MRAALPAACLLLATLAAAPADAAGILGIPDDEGCVMRDLDNRCVYYLPGNPTTHAGVQIEADGCVASIHRVHVSGKGPGPWSWTLSAHRNGVLLGEAADPADNNAMPSYELDGVYGEYELLPGETLEAHAQIRNGVIAWDQAEAADAVTCAETPDGLQLVRGLVDDLQPCKGDDDGDAKPILAAAIDPCDPPSLAEVIALVLSLLPCDPQVESASAPSAASGLASVAAAPAPGIDPCNPQVGPLIAYLLGLVPPAECPPSDEDARAALLDLQVCDTIEQVRRALN